jgi:uncharacterized protein YfaS (alpha-2-macroglobulin family)
VEVSWDGKSIGSKEKGYTTVMIPGIETFQMIDLRLNDGVIEVSFSSPIGATQDLRGFLSLSGNTNVRYSVENNIVRIFGDNSGALPAGAELSILDLQDVNGNRLVTPVQFTVPDRWEIPGLRFIGTGVILPTSQGANLVVETRNLSGLLVEAFQIYNQNMLQYLQVNSLSGERELERVGEPVWTKSVDFEWKAADQNRWVRRGLDMSELSKRFPGGMFHIRISFRPKHVQYICSAGHGNFSNMEFPGDSFRPFTSQGETSYWDNYYDQQNFSWSDWHRYSSDPCHPSFYVQNNNGNVTQGRNVHVSDLGLLAKRAYDGSWVISATNLITARSASGTEITVYNYQGRSVFKGRTGQDGTVNVPAPAADMKSGSRLVVYGENNLGRAYLRINDSLALATSHFDVAGGMPSTNINGLIYGERDVWRPGDDIYLTFLLSDPVKTLPANHPVSFELEDPRGRPVVNRTFTSSVDGFYPIAVSTSQSAPTGDWTARVKVGGRSFSRNIKIETVMPNRLKMNIDFGDAEIIKSGSRQSSVSSEWLYGAPASDLKADIFVTFNDKETAFSSFTDYSFRDPSRTVSSERRSIWEGTLNKEGKASFTMNLNPGRNVPGKVTARFMTRVFEPSGVFSSEQISREYSPYKRYVGIKLPKGDEARNMLLTDTDHKADIVLLDEDGKLLTESVELNCAIYKLSWRWWWEKGIGEPAEFASTLSRTPISRGTVTAVNGRASWNFRINYPDWGRYLVIVRDSAAGSHAAAQVVYIDWPGWAGRAQEGGQGSSAMLALTPGKSSYNVGERVQISFPSNKEASALIVIEKGGQVVRSEWLQCTDQVTRFEFTADQLLFPNIYIHVTLLQPHNQTQNDHPIRLYGIVPITINDPRVALSPRITAPENWKAESRVSFTVNEAGGRPMAYTVAVVDEGLLGLTRFTLPNPRNTFYAREASFLKSWDLFQDVIGAYSGRLETLLAIGGSDDSGADPNKETQRFKPVVRFFGPFELKAGESKTETFDLPPYIGALRIMVLAASSTNETPRTNRAFGIIEKSVKVTSDLMVFGSLPRVLSPNDEFDIPVYVNSYLAGKRNVKVSLAAPGAAQGASSTMDVSFDSAGEKLVKFKVKAPPNPGRLQFTIKAESSGLETAQHVVDIDVRSTAIPVTKSVYNLIQPGEIWRGDLSYPGREGTNTLTASFSRLPPINLEKRLEYLVKYPHGCIEQTTSGAFPQVFLDRVMLLDDRRRAEIRSNVNAGIDRVLSMQLNSGGFGYWPGDSSVQDWSTSYAGHFLIEAKRAGYQVRDSALVSWVNYQKNTAAIWQASSRKYTEQAYRLYTLALSGNADLGSMNRLRSVSGLPVQATWRLAAAYWLAGQRDTARAMIRNLAMPEGSYRELSATFGSSLRDKAMILETLVLIGTNEDSGRTRAIFDDISKVLSEDTWLSTQETAYALVAMTPYMQNNSGTGELNLSFTAASRNESIRFTNSTAEFAYGSVSGTQSAYTVTNRSSVPVYVGFTSRGLPVEGSEPALSEGLTLAVEYRSGDGKNTIDPANLKIGEDMEIVVRVRNSFTGTVEEVALVHPLPASWEIVNTRIGGSSSSNYRYQDIRDDRVMTYFNLNRGEERVIRFRVNKAYEGAFFRPAIHAYAMYDESIRALIPGIR